MGILSKEKLIKRIAIGEMLVTKEIRDKKQLNKETLKKLKECLAIISKNSTEKEREKAWQDYTKELVSQEILRERRLTIEKYIRENFVGEEIKKIREKLESDVKQILKETGSEDLLKDFKNEEGEIEFPIFVDTIEYACLKGANYDLRLGENVYVTTEKTPRKLTTMGADSSISIEPGEFGILMAHEYLFVPPDLIGFISIRLTFKQKGLVNISGFHVDPGFHGQLMFAVFNAGPNDVPLRYKEAVFMIMFEELTKPLSKIEKSRWQGMKDIPVETIFGLRGTSVSVRNLDERVRRLEIIFPLLVTGIVSLVIAVIAWILTHW